VAGTPSSSRAGGTPGAWTAYTPDWTSSGTAPAIGNGSSTGRFLIDGTICYFVMNLVFGSTTTFGTGTYSFSLPSGAVAKTTGGKSQLCIAYGFDSGTAHRTGVGRISAGATVIGDVVDDDNASAWGATVPQTWANGDEIRLQGAIEIDG
jgi:hypothetical protein